MKKLIFICAVIIVLVAAYFIIARNGMPRVSINNVKSVSIINRGNVLVKELNVENNKDEIAGLISMYNKSKRFYKNWDTTTDVQIIFEMKEGRRISIHGNTQGFQYLSTDGKTYRISGKELTEYIRGLSKGE